MRLAFRTCFFLVAPVTLLISILVLDEGLPFMAIPGVVMAAGGVSLITVRAKPVAA